VVKGGDFVHQKNQDVCDGLVGWEFLTPVVTEVSDLRWSKASTRLTLVASRRNFSITSCGQHHGNVSSNQDIATLQ